MNKKISYGLMGRLAGRRVVAAARTCWLERWDIRTPTCSRSRCKAYRLDGAGEVILLDRKPGWSSKSKGLKGRGRGKLNVPL
jgi:hypothetical protein